ncbi:hypothetical protein [uncultured Tateyamaria sp.]|uniref:hypothetical protein n=1 Tax=uncultured Tateyamaria sp. TaxID=455651 RepID=UPI0026349345|nr:hypothetical protein [uncultured Tateyamaria sp.]
MIIGKERLIGVFFWPVTRTLKKHSLESLLAVTKNIKLTYMPIFLSVIIASIIVGTEIEIKSQKEFNIGAFGMAELLPLFTFLAGLVVAYFYAGAQITSTNLIRRQLAKQELDYEVRSILFLRQFIFDGRLGNSYFWSVLDEIVDFLDGDFLLSENLEYNLVRATYPKFRILKFGWEHPDLIGMPIRDAGSEDIGIWLPIVAKYIDASQLVIILPFSSRNSSAYEEFKYIHSMDYEGKTIIVMPGETKLKSSYRSKDIGSKAQWEEFRKICLDDFGTALPGYSPKGGMIGLNEKTLRHTNLGYKWDSQTAIECFVGVRDKAASEKSFRLKYAKTIASTPVLAFPIFILCALALFILALIFGNALSFLDTLGLSIGLGLLSQCYATWHIGVRFFEKNNFKILHCVIMSAVYVFFGYVSVLVAEITFPELPNGVGIVLTPFFMFIFCYFLFGLALKCCPKILKLPKSYLECG